MTVVIALNVMRLSVRNALVIGRRKVTLVQFVELNHLQIRESIRGIKSS